MQNKYQLWYDRIINRARDRSFEGYGEKHHILPRSLGGDDSPENLVKLTAREHFICHILLAKFTQGKDRNKMIRAVIMMKASASHQPRYFNSRLYEQIKKEYVLLRREEQQGESNHFYGKTHSDETRSRMSASKKALYGNGNHPHIGMKRGEETRKKISGSKKGKPSKKKGQSGTSWSTETRSKMEENYAKGTYSWWNNGTINQRTSNQPGEDWVRGRLKSSMSDKVIGKKPHARKWHTATVISLADNQTLNLTYDEYQELKKISKVGNGLNKRKRPHNKDVVFVLIKKE